MSADRDFKDHFSGHAGKYASSRPHYPPELFDWLVSVARGRSLAWDVATGSGQAACALAGIFKRVVTTDLEDAWGAPDRVRAIQWPIVIRAGYFRL